MVETRKALRDSTDAQHLRMLHGYGLLFLLFILIWDVHFDLLISILNYGYPGLIGFIIHHDCTYTFNSIFTFLGNEKFIRKTPKRRKRAQPMSTG